MTEVFLSWSFRTELWWASAAMAVFASYVALDLAHGVASSNRFTALRSLLASAVALATGTVACHFVVLSERPLPLSWGFHGWVVIGALVVAFAGGLTGVLLSARHQMTRVHVALTAVVLAAGACAVPMAALLAWDISPGVHWNWALIGVGWALACISACAALPIVAAQPRSVSRLRPAWQAGVSLALGLAIALGNAAVLFASQVPQEAVSLGTGQTSLSTISALALIGAPALLLVLLMTSILESHFRKMLRRTRDELKRAAQTDRLTGLPNRSMIEEALQQAAGHADRRQHRLGLLFINVDGLKAINESFGQGIGDKVLREVAQRLSAVAGPRDMVARAGGDEFLLLFEGNPSMTDADRTAAQVLGRMNELCRIDDHDVSVSCTVGVAMYPAHGSADKLIAHAAAAMHAAKRHGGASRSFFEESMVAGARDQLELLKDLRRAIENQELELHYQPKVHAPSGQITGAEALMRWHHPQRGTIGPNVFIPLAERFGLINALGNWLIEDVCRQIRAWHEKGLRMRVAINLSVHQLRQADLVERIASALRRNHIEPSQLTCEITESAAMDDTRVTLLKIAQLAEVGVHLSIDDFGTGYSSLSYLRRLAAEELKIDRSFVCDLESSADARAIVDAVVKLAQALGLKVVAEGVETEAQQDILRTLGCNELQGFLFARPMPAQALAMWAMDDEGPRALDFRASLFGDALVPAILEDRP